MPLLSQSSLEIKNIGASQLASVTDPDRHQHWNIVHSQKHPHRRSERVPTVDRRQENLRQSRLLIDRLTNIDCSSVSYVQIEASNDWSLSKDHS